MAGVDYDYGRTPRTLSLDQRPPVVILLLAG